MSQRLVSYKQVNELYNMNFEPIPFTEFEIELFNNRPFDIDITVYSGNVDNLVSLCNFYTIYGLYNKYVKCVKMIIDKDDARGYLKLGYYLVEIYNKLDDALEIYNVGGIKGNNTCIASMGLVYIYKKDFDKALKYLMYSFKQGKNECIPSIVGIFGIKENFEMTLKFSLIGLLKGVPQSMIFFNNLFKCEEDENGLCKPLYMFLLNFKNINQMIDDKIQQLSKNIEDLSPGRDTFQVSKDKKIKLNVNILNEIDDLVEPFLVNKEELILEYSKEKVNYILKKYLSSSIFDFFLFS